MVVFPVRVCLVLWAVHGQWVGLVIGSLFGRLHGGTQAVGMAPRRVQLFSRLYGGTPDPY